MLDIVVLIKQVPEINKVVFDAENGRIDRSSAKAEINPFDLNSLEVAVQICEKLNGKITAISMGPPSAESALREALAMGANRAILCTDKRFSGADTLATSFTLVGAIRKAGRFDLVICGEKTVDGDTGQVGPEVAELLGIPQITYTSELVDVTKEKIVVISETGEGSYLMESKFPLLLTVTNSINKPRSPGLKDRLRARESRIEVLDEDSLADVVDIVKLGLSGSATKVIKVVVPSENDRRGVILEGDGAAISLVKALDHDGILGASR